MKRCITEHKRRETTLLEAIQKLEKTVEDSNTKFEQFRKEVLDEFKALKEQFGQGSTEQQHEETISNTEQGESHDNKDEERAISTTDLATINTNNNNNNATTQDLFNVINENRKTIDQLDLRLQLHENTMFDGRVVWRIDRFRSRLKQAASGKVNALHSAPSYTSQINGYKFCLRIYPNGDGLGKGTHLSLFIVLMKSDYDNLLQWPFTNTVKFVLVNQEDRKKDLVEQLIPNVSSQSFQKPVSEMNLASGCPLFITLEQLENDGYIMDDTLFIDVTVQKWHDDNF